MEVVHDVSTHRVERLFRRTHNVSKVSKISEVFWSGVEGDAFRFIVT
jgi:hypothetical protein